MSEFWVSKKKYFCKYCDVYIADDAPSRQHHENGMRHQGNKDRFIRGLYKEGERRKKDLEEEKREMARVERAAQAAFAQDVSSGHARHSSSSASSTPAPAVRKPPPKPSNPYANYSTAASLGYSDPDADKIAAREHQRRTEGIISGTWQVVEKSTDDTLSESFLGKRSAEEQQDEPREFKLRKRTLEAGLGKIYDPGALILKPRTKEDDIDAKLEASSSMLAPVVKQEADATSSGNKWKRMGDKSEDPVDIKPLKLEEYVKEEEMPVEVKAETSQGIFFRKRKPVGGTRAKRSNDG